MRNPALEREILAANHDSAAYLVYADWLQTHEDPRGELIIRQVHEREPQAFLEEHADAFLGRFAGEEHPETFDLEWRNGFIKTATIGWEMFGGENEDDSSGAQLEQFLRLESAGLLESLHLGPTADEDEMSLDVLAAAIDAVGVPSLRVLYLGDTSDWDISSTSTRMPSPSAIPNLHALTLRGGSISLPDAIDHPELRSFTVETGGLGSANAEKIANARFPKLEELEIWFGDPNYGGATGPQGLEALFTANNIPNVKKLGLKNCAFTDAVVSMLIGSPLLRQITHLDLSMGNLSDRGVQQMLDAKAQFANLEALDVADNALTNALAANAKVLAKNVSFGTEQDPDRAVPRDADRRYGRFVSVGE
jgi:uncharacterized protein (TIGR02996 family)